MCVQVNVCHTAHIWMSEDNFVGSLLSFILGKGIQVQVSGDTGSALPTEPSSRLTKMFFGRKFEM